MFKTVLFFVLICSNGLLHALENESIEPGARSRSDSIATLGDESSDDEEKGCFGKFHLVLKLPVKGGLDLDESIIRKQIYGYVDDLMEGVVLEKTSRGFRALFSCLQENLHVEAVGHFETKEVAINAALRFIKGLAENKWVVKSRMTGTYRFSCVS